MTSLVNAAPRRIGELPAVGPISYGMWRLSDDPVLGRELLETALAAGMNLLDTADIYGFQDDGSGFGDAEATFGKLLAAEPALRDRMVLATKGGITPPRPYDSSPAYLRSACEASLRRLSVDVIDLYFIHRPDMFTHPASVAQTLTALRSEGKIREVGVSNHTPAQAAALAEHLPFPIAATQPEFSPVELSPMRDGTLDDCMRLGVVPMAWSPLAGGRIPTGDGVSTDLLGTLDALAEREGVDRSAIAIAFVLAHPSAPIAIIGSQTPSRVAGATAALDVTLSRDDVYAIVQASEGVPLP